MWFLRLLTNINRSLFGTDSGVFRFQPTYFFKRVVHGSNVTNALTKQNQMQKQNDAKAL